MTHNFYLNFRDMLNKIKIKQNLIPAYSSLNKSGIEKLKEGIRVE